MSGGAIAGLVLGACFVIALSASLVWIVLHKRSKKKGSDKTKYEGPQNLYQAPAGEKGIVEKAEMAQDRDPVESGGRPVYELQTSPSELEGSGPIYHSVSDSSPGLKLEQTG